MGGRGGWVVRDAAATVTMVDCAIVEARGKGSGKEITVPIFASSPLNCRRLRFSGGCWKKEGENWCMGGCDTNASNYCHMRSLSLSRSESFPRHSGKQKHIQALFVCPVLPPPPALDYKGQKLSKVCSNMATSTSRSAM